jgi:hypothetical protein
LLELRQQADRLGGDGEEHGTARLTPPTACRFGLGLLARRSISSIDQFEADARQQRP